MSEGIDVNKIIVLREGIICHYWFFVEIDLYFSQCMWELSWSKTKKAMGFNDVGIFSVKGNDYRIHFWYISKDEAINLFKNVGLAENSETL